MSSVSRTADLIYTYRFLRLLTTPWEEQDAYEFGIIDKDGKVLRSTNTLKTSEEKASFTLFHKLIFNLKRLLEKLPFGKTRLASYGAALFLLRENTELSDIELEIILDKMGFDFSADIQEDNNWFLVDDGLSPGLYSLKTEALSPITLESLGKGSVLVESMDPVNSVLGVSIFEAIHLPSKTKVYITASDIEKK